MYILRVIILFMRISRKSPILGIKRSVDSGALMDKCSCHAELAH